MVLIMVMWLLTAGPAPSQSPAVANTCESIDKVDFMNSELNFESNSLKFRDGRACTSDSVDSNSCDWEHTVTLDKLVLPEPGQTLRLIIITSSHKTGGEAWGHVLLFECRNNRVTGIFNESYHGGVTVERLDDTGYTLVSGEYSKTDPECCPSKFKREIFHWDRKKHAFTSSVKIFRK